VLENQTPTRRDDLISVIYAILALILGALPWDLHYNAYIKNPEAQESLRKFSGQKREDAKKKLYDGIAMKLKKWEARHLFFEFEIYDEYREICAIYEHFLSLKPQEDPNYDIIDVSKNKHKEDLFLNFRERLSKSKCAIATNGTTSSGCTREIHLQRIRRIVSTTIWRRNSNITTAKTLQESNPTAYLFHSTFQNRQLLILSCSHVPALSKCTIFICRHHQ